MPFSGALDRQRPHTGGREAGPGVAPVQSPSGQSFHGDGLSSLAPLRNWVTSENQLAKDFPKRNKKGLGFFSNRSQKKCTSANKLKSTRPTPKALMKKRKK